MADEQVRFDVLINAKASIKELREMSEAATSVQERVAKFSSFLVEKSKAWNIPVKQLLNTFKQLNAEMAKQKTQTIFGNVGGKNIFDMSGQFLQAAQAAGRFQVGADGVVTSTKKVGEAMESAGKKAGGFRHGIDLVRTALGTLSAVAIFQVLTSIQQFFTGAIEQAKQFEATLYRISNAERQLSLAGLEVSVEGLKKGIDDIKKALPIFSKEDIAELIGSIATTTKELGFNEEQILKLGAAISILNVNSTETETLLQTQAKVTNSLVSPQAKSIGNLGLAFGKAKIEAKAFQMQLLQTGETFEDLTEREKTEIKYQIVLETAGIDGIESISELKDMIRESGGDFQALNEYLESNAAKLEENSAAWKDFQTAVGQVIIPFIPALTEFFRLLTGGVSFIKVVIVELRSFNAALLETVVAMQMGAVNIFNFMESLKKSAEGFRMGFVNEFFKEIPEDAPQWFMEGWGKHIKEQAETATGPLEDLGEATDAVDFEEFENKIEDIISDAENSREDLAEKRSQKLEDIDEEYRRKALDAQVDYGRKVEDINRDYERDIAKIKGKQREEDLRAEENYQLKLWELRMRFLMDLEDALHARDARQVIRLQKQYEIDKEALEKKKDLDDRQREFDQKSELEDAAIKRDQRLADAKLEYEQKLADQRLAKQRELDDLNVWYAREQQDIETNVQRKLEALISGWIQEKKITEENAAAVYGILAKYFGPGGMTDQLYAYMAQKLATPLPIPGFGGGTLPYWQMLENQGAASGGGGRRNTNRSSRAGRQMAEGGTLIATRPTTVTFGEAGAEMASFTPLSRLGRNVNTVFSDGGGGGLMGQITLAVDLSPDLEVRMTENAMNNVADVVLKVNRSKI